MIYVRRYISTAQVKMKLSLFLHIRKAQLHVSITVVNCIKMVNNQTVVTM